MVIACSLLVSQAWGKDPEPHLQASFTAEVTVHADGRADIGPLSGVQGQLAALVEEEVARLDFVPALRSGSPATTSSTMTGYVRLLPADEETYALALSHVSLMPLGSTPVKQTPPLYPRQMMRSGKEGAVEITLRVDAQGRVVEATTVMSTHAAFEKAVRDAMRHWRFLPTSEETVFTVPVSFRMAGTTGEGLPGFQCAVLPANAHVEGQDGCVDTLQLEISVRAR